MTINSTITASPKYDKKAIREFLMHLAGELKVQQLGFAGKPAPAKKPAGPVKKPGPPVKKTK